MLYKLLLCLIVAFIAVLSAQSNYEILFNRPDITGLTGGGATNLDGIATTGLAAGAMIAVYDGSETRIYRLTAGTNAENSPTIIRPDDFADPGNAKVWIARLSSDPSELGASESDPVFAASPASGITAEDTVRWNGVFGTAASATVATQDTYSTFWTLYRDLATVGPSVTVDITSGKALVMLYSYIQLGVSGSGYVSFSATGVAANDSRALFHYSDSGAAERLGATFLITGLTNGSNTFTMKYKGLGGTARFKDREIIVIPLP